MPVCREAHGQTIVRERGLDTACESVETFDRVNNASERRRFDRRAVIDALGATGVVSRAFVLPPSCRRVTVLLTSVAAQGELF